MEIHITEHAHHRMKERMGLPRSARAAAAARAMQFGIRREDAVGPLRDYLSRNWERDTNTLRVYGNFVFAFEGERLVTVFELPKNLKGSKK